MATVLLAVVANQRGWQLPERTPGCRPLKAAGPRRLMRAICRPWHATGLDGQADYDYCSHRYRTIVLFPCPQSPQFPQTRRNAGAAPFDDALALEPAGPDRFLGRTTPAYWNMIGPFGGITATTLLQAVLQHPQRLGDPIALTVNFAGPIAEGPFEIEARPSHQPLDPALEHGTAPAGRGGDHRQRRLRRATSRPGVAARPCVRRRRRRSRCRRRAASPGALAQGLRYAPAARCQTERRGRHGASGQPDAVLAARRAGAYARLCRRGFVVRYLLSAHLPQARRLRAGRHGVADHLFPCRRRHAGGAGRQPRAGQRRAQVFRQGYFDQSAQIWSAAGELLATSHQIVYYKE